jgi:hypothetical protein
MFSFFEINITVKFIRKGIKYNMPKVGRNGKRRNISCSPYRKWE